MRLTILLIALFLLISSSQDLYAWPREKPVTPYGDFCPLCNQYGVCDKTMSHDDARKAMIDYYYQKGFGVELERKRGRFIRARIKDESGVVDVIIFDRRTGRVRSIY